jgi:hypothetical protein
MRFELKSEHDRATFLVFDVDHSLEPALSALCWEQDENRWRKTFLDAAPVPSRTCLRSSSRCS